MKKVLIAVVTGALPSALVLSTAPARAGMGDECQADADCGDGLVCEVVGGTACACPSGGECEPCEPEEIKACVPGPCASDADCGDGLVCVTYEVPCADVATPDCPPGADCGGSEREAPSCDEPVTQSVCAPRWVLPCEAAADCGAGFACEPVEICECRGGGATDPAEPTPGGSSGSGGDDGSDSESGEGAPMPPPEEPDCTCTPGDTNQCVPIEVACDEDADCAEGWSCDEAPVATTCAVPEGGDGADCEEVPADPAPGRCEPSGWFDGGGRGDDFGIPNDAEEVAHAGSDPTSPTTPSDDDGEIGGSATSPSSGCGAAPGGLALGLALAALALALRRRTTG